MTPLDAALAYAERGFPLIPCRWWGDSKTPLITEWSKAGSRDSAQLAEWWQRWPRARLGMLTGKPSGIVILDVDIKNPHRDGRDTLDELGFPFAFETPLSHTPSGGLHFWFCLPAAVDIRNTQGGKGRGIGPGIDLRGTGGQIMIPGPDQRYRWDPLLNLDSIPLAPFPPELLPHETECKAHQPVESVVGLSPYGTGALNSACRNIIAAPNGEQEATLNSECFAIGTLAGARVIPEGFALRTLLWAVSKIPNYDLHRPWRTVELEAKVRRAFDAGLSRSREVRCHG